MDRPDDVKGVAGTRRTSGRSSLAVLGPVCLCALCFVAAAVPAAATVWPQRSGHAAAAATGSASHAVAAAGGAVPNLASAVNYLTDSTNLVGGTHYEPDGPGFTDFGLTMDGALALAAARTADTTLSDIVAYVAANANGWTGLGTSEASGGSLGKEALVAEAVGDDPHDFGGNNLISALDKTVCAGPDASCAAAGNYAYTDSTYSQALGVVAQMRAGDWMNAIAPVRYIESLQNADGGWPSLIPPGADAASDVDSTATAVMALAVVPGPVAAGDVQRGVTWIAGRQELNGGFPGASGDNTNSAALALMAMNLDKAADAAKISAGLSFLAAEQNADGGFTVSSDPGSTQGSDLRASTQAVSGAVGTPLGTLSDPLPSTPPAPPTPPSPTVSPASGGQGYWEVAGGGHIFNFGNAPAKGSMGRAHLNRPIVGMAPTPDGKGYWLVASDGGIFTFGDAPFDGSTGGTHLNRPIVGMAPTPDGNGYWLVASDGGIFTFGDAHFYGSTGATHLNKPVVGMAPTPDGNGYWLVASDGGIFTFGGAHFEGSTGGTHLNRPVVGMAPTPDGKGYWLVASDGGIFTFGDAHFYGSTGSTHLNRPVVGMAPTPDGKGYWLVASDGGIFTFGDAHFYGSTGSTTLTAPIVGLSPRPLAGPTRPSSVPHRTVAHGT